MDKYKQELRHFIAGVIPGKEHALVFGEGPKKPKPPSVDPKEWETILKSCEKYFYRHDMSPVAIGRMFGLSSALVSLILARKWKPRVKDSGSYIRLKEFYTSGRYKE